MWKPAFCLFLFTCFTCFPFLSAQQAIHLDSRVNTAFEEREPILSPDAQHLYFWRRESPVNVGGIYDPGDIWVSNRDRYGEWQEAEHLSPPLNGAGHDFVWQVSPDLDTLWLNQNPPGVNDVAPAYSTRLFDGRWSPPTRLHIRNISFQGQYKDFFLTPERIMLLPNTTERGFGGSDLFVCFPINDTAWGRPINLGSVVNTEFDEDAPFLSPDGKTLYFNSNGHGGEGDHDIFVSRRLDDTWRNWSQPQNVGPPINTRGYEFDFIISQDETEAYWCSDENSYGSNDIFYMDLTNCAVDIYPEGDQQVCIGQTLTLEAGYIPANELQYQWYKDGQLLQGATDRTLRITQSGEYQLYRLRDGCEATSEIKRVSFVSPPTAQVESIGSCLEDSIQLIARTSNGTIYQWQLNGLDIPAATDRVFWAKQSGEYSVRISNGSCATPSASVSLQRFLPPTIYTEADTVHGILPTLPQWLWTNKLPREKRGSPLLQQLAIGPNGESYLLGSVARRGKYLDQIHGFFSQGIYRETTAFEEMEQTGSGNRYLAVDPDGQLIVADNDRYLSQYSRNGRMLWSTRESRQQVSGLAVDPLGNIYSSGRFEDTLYMGSYVIPTKSARDGLFLAKHSSRGELLWVKTYAVDGYPYDFGNALQVDCMGQIYMAGGFRLIANFEDPILRAGLRGDNFFVVKFSPEGEVIWGKGLQTDRTRLRTSDFHVDCEGNVSLCLNRDLYRLSTHGKTSWKGKLLQPNGAAKLTRLTSANEDVYVAGYTDRDQMFVTKLNRLNRQIILWKDNAGAIGEGSLPAIASDAEGNVLVAGISKGNDFPGAQMDLTSGSYSFLMKYGKQDFQFERKPVELCGDQPVNLFVRETDGVSYQWYRNDQILNGATKAQLLVAQPGNYQVMSFSGDCQRISEPLQVIKCGGNSRPNAPVATVSTVPVPIDISPEPPARKPIIEPNLTYNPDGTPKKLKNRKVKPQNDITIRSSKATVYVWDHAAADRDTISLNINGEWVLEYYELNKRKIAIEFDFKEGDNFITLYAHNLGTTPPNTASIMVDDGIRQQTMQLRSTLRNCGSLRIRKE